MDVHKNLYVGLPVLYVLRNGETRPLIATKIEQGRTNINGVLHFDGTNDREKLDFETRGTEKLQSGTHWIEDVPYAEPQAGKPPTPGTWHFIPALAAAART
jgi:hypothetical protein